MSYKEGQKVRFLHRTGRGEVLEIKGNDCRILRDDGFEEWMTMDELVPYAAELYGEDVEPGEALIRVKGDIRNERESQKKKKKSEVREVDLHLGELMDFIPHLSDHEKLLYQMEAARKALENARRTGVKKLILIHGVGQGRLREELHRWLNGLDKLEFYDADYSKYGFGATEVRLWK